MRIDFPSSVLCDACEQMVPCASLSGYAERGLSVYFSDLGHYDGFFDNFPTENRVCSNICHDCTVKLLDALPGLKKKLKHEQGTDLHSSKSAETRCCDFCWTEES